MESCFTNVLHDTNTIFVNLLYITQLQKTWRAPNGSLGGTAGTPQKSAESA
jgi:hypothetical protein